MGAPTNNETKTMQKLTDLKRGEKVNQGGAWEGDLWLPQGPSEADLASSEKYGNGIRQDPEVRGFVRSVLAFNGEKRFALYTDEETKALLLPNWFSLNRDLREGGMIDMPVDLVFEGGTVMQSGRNKGNTAFNVGIYPLR